LSGDLAVAAGFAAALAALASSPGVWRDGVSPPGATPPLYVAASAFAFLLVALFDAARPLGVRVKLVSYVALALAAAWLAGPTHKLPFGALALRFSFWGSLIGSGLWVFAMLNFVSFMNRVPGLAMGVMAIAMAMLGAVSLTFAAPGGAALAFAAAGALVGVLIPDLSRSAGKAGAVFAGALGALTSLMIVHRTGISPFVPALAMLPIVADASLTLIWRLSRGQSLREGRGEALYQIAARAGWPHARILRVYWSIAAACGACAFVAALDPTQTAPALALVLLAGIFAAISGRARRAAQKRGIAAP
jgi:UDP-N-acetylmuramyl pentapeptide phosphotransferase/UDP-N-acetylglucosamine-1-phosphate transferase